MHTLLAAGHTAPPAPPSRRLCRCLPPVFLAALAALHKIISYGCLAARVLHLFRPRPGLSSLSPFKAFGYRLPSFLSVLPSRRLADLPSSARLLAFSTRLIHLPP